MGSIRSMVLHVNIIVLTGFVKIVKVQHNLPLNHIAVQVKDVEQAVKEMEKKGVHLGYITKDGIFDTGKTKIAYLDPKDTDGIFIELVELVD